MSAEDGPDRSAPSANAAAEALPSPPDEPGAASPPAPAAAQRSEASAPTEEAPAPSAAAERTPESTSAPDGGRPGVPALAAVRDDLTAESLLALLQATFAVGRALHWSACLDTLGPITAGLPEDLTGWSEGRVWGTQAEMRWQPAGLERFSALYLGEGEALPEGFSVLASDLRAVPSAETEGLFLWGTRGTDGQYREPRLPRPLDYAGLGVTATEARVPCRLLVDAAGQVRFVRLSVDEGEA
jgi:hypothetical protein